MKIIYKEKEFEVDKGITIEELLQDEIKQSKNEVIGAKFNNQYKRLDYKLEHDGEVKLVDVRSKGGMKIYRRTLIFLMAKAFNELYPKAKIRVDYQLSNSMFCEIENMNVTKEILDNVLLKMREYVERKLEIHVKELTREQAERFI